MPITTTFSISASADDQYTYRFGATWPGGAGSVDTAGTVVDIANKWDGSQFVTATGLIRLDTSSLPDTANASSASLVGFLESATNVDVKSLTAEYYDWSADPIGSFNASSPVTTGSTVALAGAVVSSMTAGQDNTFALSNLANINNTGYTYFRLNLIAATQPAGLNELQFTSFDSVSGHSPLRLIVTYTIPGPYVRSSASGSGNSTTVPPTLPPGWQPNDVVSITVAFQGGSGTTITTPAGWTLAPTNGRVDSTTAMSQAVFTRLMQSGDSAPSFTLGNTQKYTWESVAATSDFGQIVLDKSSGQSNVSSTTVSAPTLTPSQDNALVLHFAATDTGTSFSPASGYTEDQDVATGTSTGGTAAAKTLYLMGGTLDNNFQPIQDGGTAPSDAAFATATGYQVGASSNATMSPLKPNTVQGRATFTSTAVPTGLGSGGTNANAFKSPTSYLGSFASGNWTLSAVMRSITAAIPVGMTIRSRWRVYASTDATGATSVRDLTSGTTQLSGSVAGTGNTTANMSAMSVTWAAPAITLTNEYLFFAHALEIVALSGTGNTRDAQFRQNSSSAITTTTFTPALDITSEAAHLIQTTAAATGTVSATAGVAAVNIGQLLSIIGAQQIETVAFQPIRFY